MVVRDERLELIAEQQRGCEMYRVEGSKRLRHNDPCARNHVIIARQ